MLLLTKDDIKKVFTMQDAMEADKTAFTIFSSDGSVVPLRTNIGAPSFDGKMLFMPGYIESLDAAGVKIVSVFPRNIEKGKTSVPATMMLVDATTGEVSAAMDGTYLTQVRTGAAAGVATDLLARVDATVGAIFGTGGQATTQLEAMLTVRSLKEVRVFDIDSSRAEAFAQVMSQEFSSFGAKIYAAKSSSEAVVGADIITTATTSKVPVFDGNLVKPGAHINAIGSYTPQMQEIDEAVVTRASKIFCESEEVALAEAGDLIVPLNKGLITADKITGQMGNLLMGKVKGRETSEEITLFDSVGMAVVDIVTAHAIYNKALESKVGYDFRF